MALRISMGQYLPGTSAVHRLDPRAKTIAALATMVSVFFITSPQGLALGFAFALAVTALAHVPAGKLVESIRPLLAVLGLIAAIDLLVIREGTVLAALGPIAITTGGVRVAVLYSLRLVVAVVAGALLLLTTTPMQLTDAFDSFLAPLSRIGLPGHELAMVFSLMLRFIPTLADEAQSIVDAQTSRGGAMAEGSVARRIRSVVPVLVALLASSMRHANGLSRALDARCYEGGAARTHWHPMRMRAADWAALAVTCAYITGVVLL